MTRPPDRALWQRLEPTLRLYTLSALVVAHPLLALLAKYPEFFVVRGWSAGKTWLLAAALIVMVPFPLVLLRTALARWGPNRHNLPAGFDLAVVTAATSVWVLQLLHGWRSDYLVAALAILGAVVMGWSIRRFDHVRSFLTFLSPALLVVPLVFMLDPRITRLGKTTPDLATVPATLELTTDAPIFFLVFDALSATALMDENQLINRRRYPHLAALADDATWFPNTSSVARWTLEAVPAILTGNFPEPGKLSRLADHPRNLFTLLGSNYRIVADEASTKLCPPQLNVYPRPEPSDSLPALVSDLGLVYLHRTLPRGYARRLPRVDQAWGNFIDPKGRVDSEVDRFYRFLDTFQSDAEPTLHFLHVVFPHMPYQYLPSGKLFRTEVSKYLRPLGSLEDRRSSEETRIFLYKRYLLQAGLVDKMVGDLVARLQELNLYNRSTVILTADHGGRMAAINYLDDIFFVPLLIKRPHQGHGEVDRQPVSTLDLLPSLFDLLGAEPMNSADRLQRSFLSPGYQPPLQLYQNKQRVPFDLGLHTSKLDLVAWKLEHFGNGEDPRSLYRAGGPRPDLLDLRPEDLDLRDEPRLRVTLDLGGPSIPYDPTSSFAPALISGSSSLDGYDQPCCEFALSVNGTIEATMSSRPDGPNTVRFRCTIPESTLRAGPNDIRVWVVDPNNPQRLLRPNTEK